MTTLRGREGVLSSFHGVRPMALPPGSEARKPGGGVGANASANPRNGGTRLWRAAGCPEPLLRSAGSGLRRCGSEDRSVTEQRKEPGS